MPHCWRHICRLPLNHCTGLLSTSHLRSIGTGPYWPSFKLFKGTRLREDQCPANTDVLIVGGGLIGMSVAFWLRWTTKYSVTVVDRDPSYMRSASLLGLGSIRQQFSEPENIQMSLFGSEFLRNVKQYLSVLDGSDVNIEFNPQGCLLLADSAQAETMQQNYHIQKELGAKVELLSKQALQERWPWLNVSDIELGCYGYENEGWFDPWLLLKALHAKCSSLGVNFVVGELIKLGTTDSEIEVSLADMPERRPVVMRVLRDAVIALSNGPQVKITFASIVNAAGPWAADVARLAQIGSSDLLNVPLPVEPRLQRLYVVRPRPSGALRRRASDDLSSPSHAPLPVPGLDAPFIVEPNRLCIERRGLTGEFIVYSSDDQTDLTKFTDDPVELDVDYSIFKEKVGKDLGHRIPSLASAEVTCAWTGVCDYNTEDQNLIVGSHSYHVNMYLCNGSSGHGAQHAIAIGRAITELIIYGHYKTIDLTRFSFDRFYLKNAIKESNAF